jgi:serine phosphatase RsbU (regulator of sigma subunit)/anti-sigma regulatory factor (Ser/Thr protein kinase)
VSADANRKPRIISIRWIVAGAAMALTAFSVLGVGAFAERNARRTLTRELQARLLLEARNLALTSSGALLSEFPELTLSPILSKMREDEDEFAFAVVVDKSGVIRGHADPRLIGDRFERASTLRPATVAAALGTGEAVFADDDVFLAQTPVSHRGAVGDEIGTAYVALRRDYVESMIDEARQGEIPLVVALTAAGSVAAFLLVSVLLRPIGALRAGLERIGRGDLETPVRLRDRTELGLLAETMNEMSERLKQAQEEHVEKERLAREVELAREIQSSLLPAGDLRVSGCVIDGAHRAAAEVGGDYWDVFPLSDGRIGVAIADVSGKGLAGCLVTSMLAALVRAFRDTESSPAALLVRLEKNLVGSLRPGTFITMFYGILDPETRAFRFASAGHCPLLVVRAREGIAEWHRTRGIPLGAVRGNALGATLHDECIHLAPGDVAVQYTDGINEAFDASGRNQFGFDRLEQTVVEAARGGAHAVIDALRRRVSAWAGERPPLDDETLLAVGVEATVSFLGAPDPAVVLERARAVGRRLALRGHVDTLVGFAGWIGETPGLGDLPPRVAKVLEMALYEVAANIAEHGLRNDAARMFELWWAPGPADDPVAGGAFAFVDDGKAFSPADGRVNLAESAVRRRGRGLGLEIIHQATKGVAYHPKTPAGNVTLLKFDPAKIRTEEEVTHG